MVLPNDADLLVTVDSKKRTTKRTSSVSEMSHFSLFIGSTMSHSSYIMQDIMCRECCHKTKVCRYSKDVVFCPQCSTPLCIRGRRHALFA